MYKNLSTASKMFSICQAKKKDSSWSWVVCLLGTLCTALHFGFSQSFGIFLPILSDYFNENREKTAWAGSIAIAFTLFAGPIASKLTHRFGHRPVCIVASLCCAVSLLSSSFVHDLKILYVLYGVVYGLASGTMLNATYTITYSYHNKRQSLASGIAASGSSVGVLILGPILEILVEALQWRGAFRVMSGFMLLMCMLSCTFIPVRVESEGLTSEEPQEQEQSPKGKCSVIITYLSVFKSIPYCVGTLSIVIGYLGLYVPSIHLVRFAKDLNISSKDASYLFTAIGVCSTVARVLIGITIDRKWVTPLQGVQISTLLMGISFMLSTLSKKYLHLVVFACAYGFANGIFVTTQLLFFQMILEPSMSSVGLGMGYFASSISVCGGSPLVGYIADQTGSYILSFHIVGGIVLFAALLPFVLKLNTFRRLSRKNNTRAENVIIG